MKVGLFGGTFDPIHSGHLLPVQAVRRELGLERVIYLPTAIPPHKPQRELAPAFARYAMVELALLAEEGLYASEFELTPGRPAYTVDTLEHYRRLLPDAELHLLIGADSFLDLVHWRRFADIAALARLVVLARPGFLLEPGALPPSLAELVRGGGVTVLSERPVDVSSTRLRELFSRGERPPAGWLPELVLDYIQKYDLYR
ncbi:MAG TPA: nicotinate-nucleotide adenylyltransferase [Thermoanaerobaculia bacterium]|nr:nicotinate-nucleotide adenylyltransferase [Thermoanaerobaculia bacterium]